MRKLFFLLCLFVSACQPHVTVSTQTELKDVRTLRQAKLPPLVCVHTIDRNGISETVRTKERLETFMNVNFLLPQPYTKVLRIYQEDSEGKALSIITSYHENGELKQYLEAINARAYGRYQEWHSNGEKKLLANVIAGTADITDNAKATWVFDKKAKIYFEDGSLQATMSYEKGKLQGEARFFDLSGELIETAYYADDLLDGKKEFFNKNKELIGCTFYKSGKKNGVSFRKWPNKGMLFEELWKDDHIISGSYYDFEGKELSTIQNGFGPRTIFDDVGPIEIHEYKNGVQDGLVQIFSEDSFISHIYHVANDEKHGVEIFYNPPDDATESVHPKLSIDWFEGKIQGFVKTWYPNGIQESQKEMSQNKKNGVLTAWYIDGSLMLIEEYNQDKLTRGNYLKKGEKKPVSKVVDGTGVATLYTSQGEFLEKVSYKNGYPEVSNN